VHGGVSLHAAAGPAHEADKEDTIRLDARALAITFGVLWGGCVLLVAVLNGIWPGYGGAFLAFAASIYPGFHPGSVLAGIVGALYAALDGAVCGLLLAWIYNKLSRSVAAA
jgi:hypothetical protein